MATRFPRNLKRQELHPIRGHTVWVLLRLGHRGVVYKEPEPRHVCRFGRSTPTGSPISYATNFHLVLHAVYKDPPDAKLEQLQLLEELTLQRLDELNVDSLITVMFAFARSHYPPHLRIQHRMVAATAAGMGSFTPAQLEHAACSLAALNYRPSDGWLDNFAHALQVNWDAFRPTQLAVTLVQAAACGLTRLPAATLQNQMPALLRQGVGPSSTMEPGTLAKLVWSAGYYSYYYHQEEPPSPHRTAHNGGPGGEAPGPPTPQPLPPPAVVPEQELLCWWESEGVVEAADSGDLVLLLHGLARLGVQPGAVLTRRLLGAVMGSPSALAQLPPQHLALLAWSALRLAPLEAEEQLVKGEWLDGLVAALRQHLNLNITTTTTSSRQEEELLDGRQEHEAWKGHGEAGRVWKADVNSNEGGCSGYREMRDRGRGAGFTAAVEVFGKSPHRLRPADVALVLSSLAGLGRQLPSGARGELQSYWRSGGHWAALIGEERLVMSLLGYGPEPELWSRPGSGLGSD